MPLQPREHGRFHRGKETERRPISWTCPSCEAKQEGRPEHGCQVCRAGADGFLARVPQPVFDPAGLPDYLDRPDGGPVDPAHADLDESLTASPSAGAVTTTTKEDPMPEQKLLREQMEEARLPAGGRQTERAHPGAASTLDALRLAADQRQYTLMRQAVLSVFNEVKQDLLLNLPGVLIPEEARYPVAIALRYLAEQVVIGGALDGIPDHEQLIAWADQLAPAPAETPEETTTT